MERQSKFIKIFIHLLILLSKVIYGDTDSVFVNLKGRTVEEAIQIGKEMEKEISSCFPYPIKLQYEKVFK